MAGDHSSLRRGAALPGARSPGAGRVPRRRSHPRGKGVVMAGLHSRPGATCRVGLGTLTYSWAPWMRSSPSVSTVTFLYMPIASGPAL